MIKNKTTIGIIIAIASACVCGIYPSAARAVYQDGGNAAFMMIATTFARLMIFLLLCCIKKKRIFTSSQHITSGAIGGLVSAIISICLFASLVYLPGTIVIILFYTHTTMLLFYSAWRKEERLTYNSISSTLVALFGLSLVLNLWHQNTSLNQFGIIIALLGAIATAIRIYTYGQLTKSRDPAAVGAEAFIFTFLFILAFSFLKMPHLPASLNGIGYALIGCLSMALSTLGMLYGISFIGAFKYSLLIKLEPVFTALFSILLINEILTLPQYLGMGLVVGSLALYQYLEHKKKSLDQK